MSKFRVKLTSGERIIEADSWEHLEDGAVIFRDGEGVGTLLINRRAWVEVELKEES